MLKKAMFVIVFFACKLNAQEIAPPSIEQDSIIPESFVPDKTIKDRQADKLFRMNYKVDVPIIAVGFAATSYGFSVI